MIGDLVTIDMGPEEQEALAQAVLWLLFPEARVRKIKRGRKWAWLLFWRPGESLNGRLAMVGISATLLLEAVTGLPMWQQLQAWPWALPGAYGLVVAVALAHHYQGTPPQGWGFWNRRAELTNGRLAMVAVTLLAGYEALVQQGWLPLLPPCGLELFRGFLLLGATCSAPAELIYSFGGGWDAAV